MTNVCNLLFGFQFDAVLRDTNSKLQIQPDNFYTI